MNSRTRLLSFAICAASASCLSSNDLETVRVVAFAPSEDVGEIENVGFIVSSPVRVERSLVASTPKGEVPITLELEDDGLSGRVAPIGSWPPASEVTIDLSGLVGIGGERLDDAITFSTRAVTSSVVIYTRSPPLGTRAPTSLRRLALQLSPPDAPVLRAWLRSTAHDVPLTLDARDARGSLLLDLPKASGECAPLCPSTRYRVELELDDGAIVVSELAEIETSSAADVTPPWLIESDLDLAGSTLVVRGRASEAVLVRAVLSSTASPALVAVAEPMLGERFTVSFSGVAPTRSYELTLSGEDASGNLLPEKWIRAETPPFVRVHFSEVVATPLHDWNDSAPSGEPFDASPGGGAVTDTDEWVELVNGSEEPIDLSVAGLTVRSIDATPSETRVEFAPALVFGSGGSAQEWLPGEALVVRLRGSMSQRGVTLEAYAGRALLDRIEISSAVTSQHAGGRPPDFVHEAIARTPAGRWAWCEPTPGDPLPASSCL
ncbi:MAG: hypothetical protein HYV07_18375 [Deltaproteobacteria bacterium]|nr:hypothetical protein [Deltaproteobacteria bacterium]